MVCESLSCGNNHCTRIRVLSFVFDNISIDSFHSIVFLNVLSCIISFISSSSGNANAGFVFDLFADLRGDFLFGGCDFDRLPLNDADNDCVRLKNLRGDNGDDLSLYFLGFFLNLIYYLILMNLNG
eukprot:484056_1